MGASAVALVQESWGAFMGGEVPPNVFWSRAREVGTAYIAAPVDAWLISRFDDVKLVLSDEKRFKHITEGPGSPLFRNTLLDLEGEEHRLRMGLVGGPLKSRGSLEGHVRPRATQHIERLITEVKGAARLNIALELNEPLPLLVITEMVDIPAAGAFRNWYQAIASAGSGNITGNIEIRAWGQRALDELYDFLTPVIDARRREPKGDLLSALVQAEIEGVRLRDDEIKSFTALILVGGVETSARSLTNLQRQLLANIDQWTMLRDDRSLVLPACAEALRHSPPVQGLTRVAAEPYQIDGTTIPAGARMYCSIYAANRDETHFDEPDAFLLTRFAQDAERQFSPAAHHVAFGGGRHFCTGAQLAKVEMEIVMNSVLDHMESATVVADAAGPLGERLGSPNSLEIAPTWA